MKKLLGALLALLVILFVTSCGSGNSFAGMVPEDALMVAYINEPETFLAKTDAFVTASGLGAFTGGQSLEKLLTATANIDLVKAREVLDFKKPVGIIVTGADITAPQISILIPVKSADGAKEWINGITGGDASLAFDGPVNGFLIMRPSTQAALTWPPAKTLDPAILGTTPAHHVVFAMSYSKIMSSPLMAESVTQMYSEMPGLSPIMQDMFASMGWLSLSLGVDDKAIVMKGAMQINPATDYGKLATGITGGKADVSRLGTDEFLGIAGNAQVKDPAGYMNYFKKIIGAFNLESAELGTLLGSFEKLIGAMGSNSMVSIDLDIPAGLGDDPAAINQLGLKFAGFTEVKDAGLVRAETETVLKSIVSLLNPFINELIAKEAARALEYAMNDGYFDEETGEWVAYESFEEPMASEPTELEFGFTVAKDQGDSLKYDQISVDVELAGADVEEMKLMLPAFKKLLETKIAYKDGKSYFAMGTNNMADLEAVVAGKVPGTKLTDVPGYGELAANLDSQAQVFMHVSVARIMNKIGKATENAISVDEKVPGILMTSSVKGNSSEFALAFGTKEFQSYLMSMLPLIMSLAN